MPSFEASGLIPAPEAIRFRLVPHGRGGTQFVVQTWQKPTRVQRLLDRNSRYGQLAWVRYADPAPSAKYACANAFSKALMSGDHEGASEILALDPAAAEALQ